MNSQTGSAMKRGVMTLMLRLPHEDLKTDRLLDLYRIKGL